MVRWIVTFAPPLKGMNVAVAVVESVPRFCMMNGVWKPKKRRTMFGRDTDVDPLEKPSYESASARAPKLLCSFTTDTIDEPNERTTTENWLSPGRSVSLLGTSANEMPGAMPVTVLRVTHAPSLKR